MPKLLCSLLYKVIHYIWSNQNIHRYNFLFYIFYSYFWYAPGGYSKLVITISIFVALLNGNTPNAEYSHVDPTALEQLIYEQLEGFLLILTPSGKIIFVSHTVEQLLGHLQVSFLQHCHFFLILISTAPTPIPYIFFYTVNINHILHNFATKYEFIFSFCQYRKIINFHS